MTEQKNMSITLVDKIINLNEETPEWKKVIIIHNESARFTKTYVA